MERAVLPAVVFVVMGDALSGDVAGGCNSKATARRSGCGGAEDEERGGGRGGGGEDEASKHQNGVHEASDDDFVRVELTLHNMVGKCGK